MAGIARRYGAVDNGPHFLMSYDSETSEAFSSADIHLRLGDVMRLEIDGLGHQEQRVVLDEK